MPSMQPSQSPRRIRWWPAVLVLLLAVSALAWVWISPADSRQVRVMSSMMVGAVTFLLLIAWMLFVSGLRWWQRLALFAAAIAAIVGLALSLEVREVSGDVVPHLSFKWTKRPDERLAQDLPTASTAAAQPAGSADTTATTGNDFPQFLGPHRNATVPGVTLARDWSTQPPEEVWRREVGAGNSGFVVAGGLAITQEQRGDDEMVVAYDLLTGEPRWSYAAATRHVSPLSGDGPCATPLVAPQVEGGTVYTLGATGHLAAIDLHQGTARWTRNVLEEAGAKKPEYGLCTSPLLVVRDVTEASPDDDSEGEQRTEVSVVVVTGAGGDASLVAYDAATGDPRWAAGNYRAGYASPTLMTLGGRDQIVIFHGGSENLTPSRDVTGHALDGQPLWHASWPRVQRTSQPVPLPGDRLFVSSGYGAGAKVFDFAAFGQEAAAGDESWAPPVVWENTSLKAKLTQVVYRDGYLYGLDDGILVSVDAETGERAWKRGRYGHGQTLLVGGELLLILSEKGVVALVEAVPEAYNELGRFDALDGRTWNTPALAGPYLIVRNTREAVCYRLPLG